MVLHRCNWDKNLLPLVQYGKHWLDRRRVFDSHFKPSSLRNYHPIQYSKVVTALREFNQQPDRYINHIRKCVVSPSSVARLTLINLFVPRRYNAAVILAIVYGYEVESYEDKFVRLTEEVNEIGSRALLPGAHVVNTLPFRKWP